MHEDERGRGVVRLLAVDLAVIATGIGTYFGVRGLTAGSADVAVDHAHDVLAAEAALGLDVEDELQSLFGQFDVVTTVMNWIYIWGHWPVIAVTLLWLAMHDRRIFLRLRNAMIASGLMGLCVYTTWPVAPPRLAGIGMVDTITEQSRSYRVLQPPAFVNQYAAMPSLHVGWDLVVGLALVAAASSLAVRTVGRLMPVVMGTATVLTANHYLLDVLIGAAFGLAGWAVALRVEHWRDARAVAARRGPPEPYDVASAGGDRSMPVQRTASVEPADDRADEVRRRAQAERIRAAQRAHDGRRSAGVPCSGPAQRDQAQRAQADRRPSDRPPSQRAPGERAVPPPAWCTPREPLDP